MKIKTFVLLIILSIAFIFTGFVGYQIYTNQEFKPGVKQLARENIAIIYCSYNDGVENIVDIIANKLNADVVELKSAIPYPTDKTEFLKRIDAENADISKVILDNGLIDIKKYNLIVLGTPVIQKKPCPVLQKFLEDNEARFNKKPVAAVVKFSEGGDATETMKYLYYNLYNASKKPNFLTFAEDKQQLEHELQLWFDAMEFTHGELR